MYRIFKTRHKIKRTRVIYKTLHRKLKIEQHEPHYKPRVTSCYHVIWHNKQNSTRNDQLLAHGRWFSPGTPASSITKTGRHDIAEILLKVTINTIKQTNKQTLWLMWMFINKFNIHSPLDVFYQEVKSTCSWYWPN